MKPRDNPFRSERVDALRFRPQGVSFPGLLDHLAALHHRAAIVGPHGSGKSTLFDELARTLSRTDHPTRTLFINDTTPTPTLITLQHWLAAAPRRAILMIDGADLLPTPHWLFIKFASRHRAGLIITTHRGGMLPSLCRTQTSPDLLRQLIDCLACHTTIMKRHAIDVQSLFDRHDGNLRDAFRELYDVVATQASDPKSHLLASANALP